MNSMRTVAAILATAVLAPSIAFAHAELLKSEPAKDATLAPAAKEITLTFDEAVKPATCKLAMTDGMDAAALGKPRADGVVLHVPLVKPLAAGNYKLECRVVGPDSHPVNSALTFAVATPASK